MHDAKEEYGVSYFEDIQNINRNDQKSKSNPNMASSYARMLFNSPQVNKH